MVRRIRAEDDSKHNTGTDRYLITYADLITLLLGLFVILYAASQIDEERYKEVSVALSSYFKSDKGGILPGGDGNLPGAKNAVPAPIFENKPAKTLEEISEETKSAFKNLIDRGDITISLSDKSLTLTLQEKLLFKSGSAEVEPSGNIVLDTLSNIFKGIRYLIEIDGHTDSDPIRTFRYESNWHLSGARAINVAWRMLRKGVPESNVSFRGFGSQRPVAENITPEGKALNRRVEITISELPSNAPSDIGYTQAGEEKHQSKANNQ